MSESIEADHLNEWLNSDVDKEIIYLNVLSLSGYNPYDYLLYGLEDTERRNDRRLKDKWLNSYRHIERGGWWCSETDLLTGKDSSWGCFKPNFPRIPHQQHKPIKYEHPPQVPTELFALKVPDRTWHLIADRFGIATTDKKNTIFWQWAKDNPRLPIIITEGAEKDKRYRESERGQQDYIQRLKQRIADLEGQKSSVSQSRCNTKTLESIRAIIREYQSKSTDAPRWYWANKLLADLEAKLSDE